MNKTIEKMDESFLMRLKMIYRTEIFPINSYYAYFNDGNSINVVSKSGVSKYKLGNILEKNNEMLVYFRDTGKGEKNDIVLASKYGVEIIAQSKYQQIVCWLTNKAVLLNGLSSQDEKVRGQGGEVIANNRFKRMEFNESTHRKIVEYGSKCYFLVRYLDYSIEQSDGRKYIVDNIVDIADSNLKIIQSGVKLNRDFEKKYNISYCKIADRSTKHTNLRTKDAFKKYED